MHNKCTKCTTDILRNKSQIRKTARKTGGSASSQHANSGVNTALESSQETTEKTTGKTLTVRKRILQAIKNDPRITMAELAEKFSLTQDGIYYNIKELRAEVGLHREGGRKHGRWVTGA